MQCRDRFKLVARYLVGWPPCIDSVKSLPRFDSERKEASVDPILKPDKKWRNSLRKASIKLPDMLFFGAEESALNDGDLDAGDKAGHDVAAAPALRLSDWIWQPWYAKLWWAMIPLYWLATGEPTRPEFLNAFSDSAYAIIGNILFIPITPLIVLGMRFFSSAADAGALEPHQPSEFRIFGRASDDDSWVSPQSVHRFRNAWVRDHLKF